MPILTGSPTTALAGRSFRLPELPTFNAEDWSFVIEAFDGLDGAVGPRAELVANGGGPGSVAVGPWHPGEAYYTLRGSIEGGSPTDIAPFRAALLRGIPMDRDVSVEILGGDWDTDKQVFVQRYDAVEVEWLHHYLYFTIPLVAADPYKYGTDLLTASVGAFRPEDWHGAYIDDGDGDWYDTYTEDGTDYYRAYETDEETSGEPKVAVLDSPGTVTSRRITTTITGPLMAGDWFIDNDEGERTWVELTLSAGESIVLDTANYAATLRGTDISHQMFGPFPTLREGVNTWRLITNGASAGGHMSIEALPAFE